jgi:hypothetical protein
MNIIYKLNTHNSAQRIGYSRNANNSLSLAGLKKILLYTIMRSQFVHINDYEIHSFQSAAQKGGKMRLIRIQ